MARSFTAASNEYIQTSNAVITGYPFTVNARVNVSALGAAYTIWSCVTSASGDHYFSLDKGASNTVRFRARTTSSSDALSTATLSSSTEYVITAVGTSATDRKVYINGTNDGSSTTSRTPSGMDRTTIGRQNISTPTNSFGGVICEVTVWNAALTQAEIDSLALKISGLCIRPASIVSHLPLVNNIIDSVNSTWAWAATGTAVVDHYRVFNPGRPWVYPKSTTAATSYKSHFALMGVG